MGCEIIFLLVKALALVTASFFVLFVASRAESQRLKTFGRIIAVTMWIVTAILVIAILRANIIGKGCLYKDMPYKMMHHKMMKHKR